MDIASLNPTLSAFADLHFGFNFHLRSTSSPISMNLWTFRKMPQKCKSFPVSNFLKSVTSRHCSNDTKEADILDRCGLPLNGVKLAGYLTLRYMENSMVFL